MIQVTFVAAPLTVMLMALVATFMMLPTLSMLDDDADDGVAANSCDYLGHGWKNHGIGCLVLLAFCHFIPFTTANLPESLGTGGSIIQQKSSWMMKPVAPIDVVVVVAITLCTILCTMPHPCLLVPFAWAVC